MITLSLTVSLAFAQNNGNSNMIDDYNMLTEEEQGFIPPDLFNQNQFIYDRNNKLFIAFSNDPSSTISLHLDELKNMKDNGITVYGLAPHNQGQPPQLGLDINGVPTTIEGVISLDVVGGILRVASSEEVVSTTKSIKVTTGTPSVASKYEFQSSDAVALHFEMASGELQYASWTPVPQRAAQDSLIEVYGTQLSKVRVHSQLSLIHI